MPDTNAKYFYANYSNAAGIRGLPSAPVLLPLEMRPFAERGWSDHEDPPAPPALHLGEVGRHRRPVCDFLATGDTGGTRAVAVKPSRKRRSPPIGHNVAMARRQRPEFVDEVRALMDELLPRCAEHNAGLILRSRKLRNDPDVAELKRLVGGTVGVVHVGHLLRRSQCGRARAFTAIVNLIDDGVIAPIEQGRIRPELRVRFTA